MAEKSAPRLGAELRARLPAHVFEPAHARLLWLPVHVALIVAGLVGLAHGLPWGGRLGVTVVLGLAFAGLAFVAHEALHGALIRSPRLLRWVGAIGFAPFCLSPRLWMAWHNRVHHRSTNRAGADPDALFTLAEYRSDPSARLVTDLQRSSRGLLTLLVGFSGQSLHVLWAARRRGYLTKAQAGRAWLTSALTFAGWLSLGALGGEVLLFGWLLPLLLANVVVMAHIVTNHGLSPLDDENDPLRSSLTVRVPRWFSFYTLDFGYHVEHHLLPGVSHRHGREIQRHLRELAPDRYQELPLGVALSRVLRAPRLYSDAETLLDPNTGAQMKTLGARSDSLRPPPGRSTPPPRPLPDPPAGPLLRPSLRPSG